MNATSTLCLAALVLYCPLAAADPGGGYESFEDGIPASWVATRPESLQLEDRHFKHGGQSLRWNWERGESLVIARGLGDISRTGGYGGTYGKATFGVWLHQRKPTDEVLRFEFQRGGEATAHFDFDLNFTGWRPAYLWFERDFEGVVRPDTDSIRIVAPAGVEKGSLVIDLVVFNGILDYRAQHVPRDQEFSPAAWEIRDRLFPIPGEVSEDDRLGAERLYRTLAARIAGSGEVSDSFLQEVSTRIDDWAIVLDEEGIRGQPVVFRHIGFFEGEGIEGLITPQPIADLMLEIARRYHWTGEEIVQAELAEAFLLLAHHLRDQGLEAGSGFQWNWYPGRSFASALFLMRDVLSGAGMSDWAFRFMDDNYGVSDIFDDGSMGNPHLDYFHFDTPHRLYGILLLDETSDQVRHLRAFTRRLSADILMEDGPNGFKPDGSTWHHWGHYFAYAVYCVDTLVNVMHALSDGPFRVTEEAYDRVKRALLTQRLYANKLSVPLSLHGRHPFNYSRGQNLRPSTFRTLARANRYGGSGELDRELAEAYLRLNPDSASEAEFRANNLSPEPHPSGNWTMNYAGVLMHRRDRWLAVAKGYSRYVWASEIYQRENRYGRYLSNGALEILAGGDPVNLHASGYHEDGWDWNRLDGTTVIYLPLDQLVSPRAGTEMVRSTRTFVGGLSHRENHGVFVMQLEGEKSHRSDLRGSKTYFFFGDKIVALGSGISSSDPDHPVQTNLFQKHLVSREDPVSVDRLPVADFPLETTLPSLQSHLLMDPQGTGYYVPAGQVIGLSRKRQRSRDHTDQRNTEGDFAAAWMDHGVAPQEASYRYFVLPATSRAALAAFREQMESTGSAPIRVVQQDEVAHVVHDQTHGLWGLVLFSDRETGPRVPVARTSRPCLILAERGADGAVFLTAADPDLHLDNHASLPRPLQIEIRGHWLPDPENATFRLVSRLPDRTILEFTAHQGKSFEVRLQPAPVAGGERE